MPRPPGTVTEVDVTEGDQVETGRILVVVEPDGAAAESTPETTATGGAAS